MIKNLAFSLFTLIPITFNYAYCGDFDNYDALKTLISEVESEGMYTNAELNDLFFEVERQKVTLDLMSRPAETVKQWKDYRPHFLTDRNISKGVDFWNKYHEALEVAEQQLGVPPEVIVAILGVETRYGANKGRLKVIDSLATLAFDFPRRSEYFTQELKNFLALTKEQGLDPLAIKGSYAGAMGYPQFMPSSWRKLGIDFDGDNKADLINNPIDAIGSIANYFKENGWQAEENIAFSATAAAGNYDDIINNKQLSTINTLGELKAKGFSVQASLEDATPASVISLEGDNGTEYWIGLNNFYVITTYNRSTMYAMAVFQLSQAIKEAKNTSN
jgi:membrane-bound lytic murein transglycosylase B